MLTRFLLAAMLFNCPRIFGQTMNIETLSAGTELVLLDSIAKVVFSGSSSRVYFETHHMSGAVDSTEIDSIRYILFNPNGAVPVTLSSFYAVTSGNQTTLSWTTESETGNLGWYVLRSSSYGGPYTRANSSLVPGAGTTVQPRTYTYQDAVAADGVVYYKLEQIDIEGRRSYSQVIIPQTVPSSVEPEQLAAEMEHTVKSAVRPYPTDRVTNLSVCVLKKNTLSIEVYPASGSEVIAVLHSGTFTPGTYNVTWDGRDMTGNDVAPGTYLILIKSDSGSNVRRTMVVR